MTSLLALCVCAAGVDAQDTAEVIATSVTRLNEKYGDRYTLSSLVNGYR